MFLSYYFFGFSFLILKEFSSLCINWTKFESVSWTDWFLTFLHSLRLDIATGGFLSILPLIALVIGFVLSKKWTFSLFKIIVLSEVVLVALIHAGEINAYPEWNHKLTSRVFMHLSNPDEVFRTADYSMTFWFIIYSVLEIVFGYRIFNLLFKPKTTENQKSILANLFGALGLFVPLTIGLFLLARGGWQQIPLNIDSAYFSNNHVANDLSVNSTYYFANSYMLYNKK